MFENGVCDLSMYFFVEEIIWNLDFCFILFFLVWDCDEDEKENPSVEDPDTFLICFRKDQLHSVCAALVVSTFCLEKLVFVTLERRRKW